MAAGGLRRPPTKSPNRIPFGFQASLHRVNNVFTRRFGSFAVGRVSPSPVLFGALLRFIGCPLVCSHRGPFSFFSSSFASIRAPYAVGRSACCTFHGCLQLRIMNIDNTAGQEKTDDRSNVNISATLRALAIRAFFVLVSARYSARSLFSAILLFRRPRVVPCTLLSSIFLRYRRPVLLGTLLLERTNAFLDLILLF